MTDISKLLDGLHLSDSGRLVDDDWRIERLGKYLESPLRDVDEPWVIGVPTDDFNRLPPVMKLVLGKFFVQLGVRIVASYELGHVTGDGSAWVVGVPTDRFFSLRPGQRTVLVECMTQVRLTLVTDGTVPGVGDVCVSFRDESAFSDSPADGGLRRRRVHGAAVDSGVFVWQSTEGYLKLHPLRRQMMDGFVQQIVDFIGGKRVREEVLLLFTEGCFAHVSKDFLVWDSVRLFRSLDPSKQTVMAEFVDMMQKFRERSVDHALICELFWRHNASFDEKWAIGNLNATWSSFQSQQDSVLRRLVGARLWGDNANGEELDRRRKITLEKGVGKPGWVVNREFTALNAEAQRVVVDLMRRHSAVLHDDGSVTPSWALRDVVLALDSEGKRRCARVQHAYYSTAARWAVEHVKRSYGPMNLDDVTTAFPLGLRLWADADAFVALSADQQEVVARSVSSIFAANARWAADYSLRSQDVREGAPLLTSRHERPSATVVLVASFQAAKTSVPLEFAFPWNTPSYGVIQGGGVEI